MHRYITQSKKLPELYQTAKFLCSIAWKSTYFRHCGTLYLLHQSIFGNILHKPVNNIIGTHDNIVFSEIIICFCKFQKFIDFCPFFLLISAVNISIVIFLLIFKAIIGGTNIDAFFKHNLVTERFKIFCICQ